MRLREMENKLNDLYNSYTISVEDITNTSTSKVISPFKINTAIKKIAEFGFIDEEIEKLNTHYSAIFNSVDNEAVISRQLAHAYKQLILDIDSKTNAVLKAITVALKTQEENTISIKLPPYTNLKKVSKFINDIDNIIRSVLPPNKPTEIKLNNFDTGSNWIEIVVSNLEAAMIIGEFVRFATLFTKNHLSSSLKTVNEIEKSSLTHEVKQVMLEGMKDIREQNSKLCVAEMLEKGIIDLSGIKEIEEYKNGLSVQMEKMGTYISEGAEVRPALNAPQEVQNEFPPQEDFKKIQSSVSQLLIEQITDDEKSEQPTDLEDTDEEIEE